MKRARQEGIHQSSQELEIFIGEIESLEQELNLTRMEKQKLEKALQQSRIELESMILSKKHSNNNNHSTIMVNSGVNTSLNTSLNNSSMNCDENGEKLSEKSNEKKSNEKMNEKSEKNEKQSSENNSTMKHQFQALKLQYTQALIDLSKLETNHQELQQKFSAITNENHALKRETTVLKGRIGEMNLKWKEESEKNNRIISSLSTQKISLLKNIEKLDEELCGMIQRRNELEDLKNVTHLNCAKLKEEVEGLNEKNEELQQSLHKFYEENQMLKARLYDKELDLTKLTSENSGLKAERDNLSQTILNLKQQQQQQQQQQEREREQLQQRQKQECTVSSNSSTTNSTNSANGGGDGSGSSRSSGGENGSDLEKQQGNGGDCNGSGSREEELERELHRLRESLEAKEKENRELMQICDELLRKIESSPASEPARVSS